jgi:hypothetical protein
MLYNTGMSSLHWRIAKFWWALEGLQAVSYLGPDQKAASQGTCKTCIWMRMQQGMERTFAMLRIALQNFRTASPDKYLSEMQVKGK